MSSIADKIMRIKKDALKEDTEENWKQEEIYRHWCGTPDIVNRMLRQMKKAKHDGEDCTKK